MSPESYKIGFLVSLGEYAPIPVIWHASTPPHILPPTPTCDMPRAHSRPAQLGLAQVGAGPKLAGPKWAWRKYRPNSMF